MLLYRGPHFQVVLWRFDVALFGKTALFAGVTNTFIPLHVKYIVAIFFGGADPSQVTYYVVGSPAT